MGIPNKSVTEARVSSDPRLPQLGMNALEASFLKTSAAVAFEVERMARENPELLPLLGEVHAQVARVFGHDVPLVLDVVPNPESADALPELFVYIQTRLSVWEAKTKLAQLDDEWWLDALPRANGRLNIALDYV